MKQSAQQDPIPVEYNCPVTHAQVAAWKAERPAGVSVFHCTSEAPTRRERRMPEDTRRRNNNRANHKQRDKVRVRMSRFWLIVNACLQGLKYLAAIRRINEPKVKPTPAPCD